MEKIVVSLASNVHMKISCDPGIGYELREYFTFEVPGAKFSPQYKNKIWDGKIRLFNPLTCLLYAGLIEEVKNFCRTRNYELEFANEQDWAAEEFSVKEAIDFINTLNIPTKFDQRDYQIEAFVHAIRQRRAILLSPTASGKSFIIYLLVRYYEQYFAHNPDLGNGNILIVVPTINLVNQLTSDFADYGYDTDNRVHRIFTGQEKITNKSITISTWQSIYKLPKQHFQAFDVVLGDEAHNFKAKSLVEIMTKMSNARFRYGFTGTLDDVQTNQLVLQGLFGPTKRVISTAEMIEQGYASKLEIKAIVLKYPDEIRKVNSKKTFQEEIDWLVRCPERNNFIKNLALSLKGNTLLLFQFVDKHGKVLYDLVKSATTRPVYFIHGGVDGDDREDIRRIVAQEANAIIIASSGTFSTGVNIPSLRNIIFGSPSKSKIRNLQSIGRVLRKSDNKDSATLYDIADDLTHGQKRNYTIEHFVERIRIYNEEKFDYKIYPVNLKVE